MNLFDSPHHASLSIFASHRQRPEVIDHFHGFSTRCPLSSTSQARPRQPPTPGAQLLVRKGRGSIPPDHSAPSDNSGHNDSKDEDVPRDTLTLLSQVISNLAKSANHSNSSSSQRTKVCTPDQFDGLDS
jgi:hypothetical protein